MIGSIIPPEKISNDPTGLCVLYPSIKASRYAMLCKEYNFWKIVEAAETTARMTGKLLVPRDCIHWKRRKVMQHMGIDIHKRRFYLLSPNELTDNERQKYNELLHTDQPDRKRSAS